MRPGVLVLLLAGMLLASGGAADLLIEGIRNYDFQYQIVNADDFPGYTFLTSSEIWGYEQTTPVVNGSFGGGYKLDGFVLHALNTSDADPVLTMALAGNATDDFDIAPSLENAPLVTANVSLPVSIALDESLGVANVTVDIVVNSLTPSGLNATLTEVRYGFADGTVQSLPVVEDDVPEPGSPSP